MPLALGIAVGAERSLSGLAGSGKGFRKWMGDRTAQLPPLKAWLGLAAKPTLCPVESVGQARGPRALLLIRGWVGNWRCQLGPGFCY